MNREYSSEEMDALRTIAQELADYRREFIERLIRDIQEEADEVVASGYDPTRGRGRGPLWADGG